MSSTRQLPHRCSHLLGIRLPVDSAETGFAGSFYVFANALGHMERRLTI